MTQRKDEALYVKDSTTVDEIMRYIRRQTVDPIEHDGHTIWNFSSYEFDEDSFSGKQEKDLLIPYEVTGTWAFMFTLLPDRIRQAEVLVYREQDDEYVAFKNFYREMAPVRRDEFRSSLAKEVGSEDWYE